jgi:hypothetical protein
VAVAELLA